MALPAGAAAPAGAKPWIQALKDEYSLDDATVAHLVDPWPDGIGITSLTEFCALFASEEDVGEQVKTFDKVNNKPLMTARLRNAWNSSREAKARITARPTLAVDDLEVLPQAELDSLSDQFHKRYKLQWPADIEPSDALTSRLSREMERRTLSLISLESVKTLAHYHSRAPKKIQVSQGVNLQLDEAEDTSRSATTVSGMLASLFTLMIAYARAGSRPREGAPEAATEDKTASSTQFVLVPLDVMLRYHARVAKAAADYRGPDLAAWLKTTDQDERRRWIEEARTTKCTLGEIVAKVSEQREIFWHPAPAEEEQSPSKRHRSTQPTQDVLRDGTPLCIAYNSKKGCNKPNCQMLHACSKKTRSGRPCGMKNHNATICHNPKTV